MSSFGTALKIDFRRGQTAVVSRDWSGRGQEGEFPAGYGFQESTVWRNTLVVSLRARVPLLPFYCAPSCRQRRGPREPRRRASVLGALVACFLALIAVGGQASTQECNKANVQFRGVDLVTAKWFVSSQLPPSASADEITSQAAPTSPLTLFNLRNQPSVTLFSIIEVPGKTAFGAELSIGDLDGDDEVYFNGQIVGKTSGRGITDRGHSRLYYIPPTLFVEGRNVLAIQMRGSFGRSQVGIRREPLTIGFVPRPPDARELPVRPALTPPIDPNEARAAILEADPQASGALLQVKRPSFGRFGLLFTDGLPALSEVGPTRITNRFAPEFRVQLDAVLNTELVRDKSESGIDGWHKVLRVQGRRGEANVRYMIAWHVQYPGALMTFEDGASLLLRVLANGEGVKVLPIPTEDLSKVVGEKPGSNVSAYLFLARADQTCPALLLLQGGAANLAQRGNDIHLAITKVPKSKEQPRLAVFYPFGIRRLAFPRKSDSWREVFSSFSENDESPERVLQRALRVGAFWPTATDEYFRVTPDLSQVRIYQLGRYQNLLGTESLRPFVVIPPQVTFAAKTLKYPAHTLPTTVTGVLCFTGELWGSDPIETTPSALRRGGKGAARSSQGGSSRLCVAYYDLPVPPLDERGLLNVPEQDDLKRLLAEDDVTTYSSSIAASGVDVLYKGRTQAFQAYSLLPPEKREALARSTRSVVPAYLREGRWYDSIEPLTALRFWWTYFIEGPWYDRYDQDWGNGLSLYGLHTAVKYLGEWEWVAKNWEAVEKMFSWFAVTDDWEWMRASNGVHGHGTGAGDCTNATYAGVLSYAKLARETGRTEDFHYGLYAAARAALPVLTRFPYNDFAEAHGLKSPNRLVVGFHEGEGFLQGELDRYPWNVTSLISGNGVQPEIFDLFEKYALDAVVAYERTFAAAYPQWYDGRYEYPYRTIYRNHSGYITLPHIYLRARFALDGPAELRRYLEDARYNRHLWWLGPPVLAELAQPRTKAYVAQWGKCAFQGGNIVRMERNRLRIEAQFDNRYPPDTVVFVLPGMPRRVLINDSPVAIPDLRFEGMRLTVRLRKPGINLVTIFL